MDRRARDDLARLKPQLATLDERIARSAGEAVDINTLAGVLSELVAERCDRDLDEPPRYEPARAGDIRHSLLDPSAAAARLRWSPEVPLRDGLERTVAWLVEGA